MRRKITALLIGAVLLCETVCTVGLGFAQGSETQQEPVGKTYYVSTLDGKDTNSGLSEGEALYSLQALSEKELGPGDHVYLERGSQFSNDYLHLSGVSGSPEAPIVIDAYGEGQLPTINTNGEGVWRQDYGKPLPNPQHRYQGNVSSCILLYDCAYIEVRNIAMTNRQVDPNAVYNAKDAMDRTGVAVVARNKGTLNHIYLEDLNIQDVAGNVYDKHMNNGGIYFTAFLPEKEEETGIPRYNDVLIDGCYVKNVSRWGIAAAYTAYYAPFQNTAEISDEDIAKYGHTNVRITNNYVKDPGGDAITTMYCDRPIVEYNVADGAGKQINDTDYSATTFGKVAAGVWPWKCKNAVFQYNEVFNTYYYNGQNADGQAFDADSADGTLYQYNYSHDNGGGTFMICLQQAVNSVFRYNISQNDSRAALVPATSPLAKIYNNTFYMKEGVPFIATNSGAFGQLEVKNNIIYYAGETPRNEDWQAGTTTYTNNIFYNYANVPSNSVGHITENPLLVNPGTGGTGSENGPALDTLGGYQLEDNSPAIGAGVAIADNGGQDFFGNPVNGTPTIGAYQKMSGEDLLESTYFEVQDSTMRVPMPLTVAQLLDGVKAWGDTTVELYQDEQKVTQGNVEAGMTLKLTSEDGETSKTYTLEQKNAYTYFDDLLSGVAAGVQGNIWYVQEHMADGSYRNMTTYHTDWKGWDGADTTNWHFVGCNSGKNPTGIKIVDRLKDRTNLGHAIGFRAPVDGTVRLTAEGGLKLLAANSSGQVWVTVLKNDEPIIQQTQLANDAQTGVELNQTVEVAQGDIIRIEVQNKGAGVAQGGVQANMKVEYTNIDLPVEPTDPVTTDPVTTDPVTTDPVTTDPVTTDPVTTDPVTTDPVTTDPVTTDPVTTDPVTTDPVTTDPVTTDPVTTDPVTTDPVTTDPVTTDPVQTGGDVIVDNQADVQVTVGNADQVFEGNTVITVESVSEGKTYDTVKKALEDVVADMKHTAILEITAALNGKPVQPSGKVQMTIQIPENLSTENLKLFYVAESGKTEEIAITVDKNARTVTANLEHFSTYVLANVAVDKADDGVPPTGDPIQMILTVGMLLTSAAALGGLTVVARKRRG